ncbi:bifunctional folylpolyglutamate synthase/dihydrofolate synthase [Paracidobacterium acidisoli]|uniref:Dihydrofolate synthase/folylpolyglutamate synthase n=1 Tax=Paracidobacterium acidisoli TaxID=2303751 RepID=A0A372IMU8_9BACT|nr:folylpolyglutamate synthase/dihydrofolate synthase family protein [Paracidobacterium acidisoli]MBT9331838.1 bifunctional folylpolyglutamate synthase/dihydrofolate synthase [Paracidobacterium acidisoli]
MSYLAAMESLSALAGELHPVPGQPRRKFRLEEMGILVEALGHPERLFPSVLIAGTNGKGSTSATLASILQASGLRTGLYTSPHLSRVNERVRIDGESISDDDFAKYYFRVDDCARRLVTEGALPVHPSYFESMTALAFLAFAEAKVDIAVLEVGMGGRLDATNIVEPLLSVITDISLDHTEWLGSTISAIAREKAGIMRPGGILVTLPQHPEANQVIGEVAVSLDVRGVNAAEYMPHYGAGRIADEESESSFRNRYTIQLMGEPVEIDSPLGGSHQQRNIALAIATAVELSKNSAFQLRNNNSYKLTPASIAEGIHRARWPGRLERFTVPEKADVLLDVAHNPAGAWALRSALSHLHPEPPSMTLVFGCLRDKAIGEMAQILFPLFDRVILTAVDSPRSTSLEDLRTAAATTGVPFVEAPEASDALTRALATTPAGGLIVIAGSVYLVGALRPRLAGAE